MVDRVFFKDSYLSEFDCELFSPFLCIVLLRAALDVSRRILLPWWPIVFKRSKILLEGPTAQWSVQFLWGNLSQMLRRTFLRDFNLFI